MAECQNKWIPMIVSGVCNRDTFTIWNFAIILQPNITPMPVCSIISHSKKYQIFILFTWATELSSRRGKCWKVLRAFNPSGVWEILLPTNSLLLTDEWWLLKNLLLAELSWVQRLADQYFRLYQLLNLHSCPQQIIHQVWNWSKD